MSKSIGSDDGQIAIKVHAVNFTSIADLKQGDVYVKVSREGFAEIKNGVLVDIPIEQVPKPLVDCALSFENQPENNLKYPYALYLESINDTAIKPKI